MKRFFTRKKLYLIFLILIIINTFFIFNFYNRHISNNISNYTKDVLTKFTYNIVSSYFNNELIMQYDWNEILEITKNSDGEILLVDFDLKQANLLNKLITDRLNEEINNLQSGKVLDTNMDIYKARDGFLIKTPIFLSSKYPLLSNLGPKIPIKVTFLGSLETNLKTQVKNYGLNNSLAEIYVTIHIVNNIITPTINTNFEVNYKVLLDSKLIQGRVPFIYNGELENEKSILN